MRPLRPYLALLCLLLPAAGAAETAKDRFVFVTNASGLAQARKLDGKDGGS